MHKLPALNDAYYWDTPFGQWTYYGPTDAKTPNELRKMYPDSWILRKHSVCIRKRA